MENCIVCGKKLSFPNNHHCDEKLEKRIDAARKSDRITEREPVRLYGNRLAEGFIIMGR